MTAVKKNSENMDSREKRRITAMTGTMTFMGMFAIGNPIIILALYLIFDWSVAVLALPVLFILEFKYLMPIQQKRAKVRNIKENSIFWFSRLTLLIVPLTAVVIGDKEIMRLWAVLIAFALGAVHANDVFSGHLFPALPESRRKWYQFFSTIVPSIAFIGFSELIWHFSPIWLWLLFHASFLIVLVGLTMISATIIGKLMGGGQMFVQSDIKYNEPPTKAADDDSAKLKLFAVLQAGKVLDCGELHYSQAVKFFNNFDWSAHFDETVFDSEVWIEPPYVKISAGFTDELFIAVKRDGTVKCQFRYDVAKQGGFFGKLQHKTVRAVGLPPALVEKILKLFWQDKTAELHALLQPYEIEDSSL